jgi:hypothetical protein
MGGRQGEAPSEPGFPLAFACEVIPLKSVGRIDYDPRRHWDQTENV